MCYCVLFCFVYILDVFIYLFVCLFLFQILTMFSSLSVECCNDALNNILVSEPNCIYVHSTNFLLNYSFFVPVVHPT